MFSLNRFGPGMSAQFLLLVVLSFSYTQAFIRKRHIEIGFNWILLRSYTNCAELSEEYLKDIEDDESTEQAAGEYNYDHQGDDWVGTCATGLRQSPIDLVYSDVSARPLDNSR